MLATRTKVLYAVSTLAPVSILIARLDTAAAVRQAKLNGAWGDWVEPGVLIYILFIIGCVSLLLALVYTVVDARRKDS